MSFLLQQSTHRMIVRYHEAIGHLFVPNLNARLHNETGGYFVRTNSLGFRSHLEFEPEKGRRPRVLMIGDSYLAGDNIGNDDRLSDHLARMLDVEVYNYGLSGSGLDQGLLIHRHFAAGVEADLVIIVPSVDTIRRIQVSHRDSIDRVTGRRVRVPKPYFTLEDGGLCLQHAVVPRERPEAAEAPQPVYQDARASRQALTRLLDWYRTSPQTRGLRQLATYPQQALQSATLRLSNVQPYEEYKSSSSGGWLLLRAIMDELIREIAPVPVLIAPIPSTLFLTHRLDPIYQPLFETFEDRERGVHVVDLTTPMTRGGWRERRALSFRYDSHFSAAGHRRAAEILVDEVEKRGLLPDRTQRAHTSGASATSSAARESAPKQARPLRILGISCFYHDSAAALIEDGRIVAAAAEERFSRIKNDRRFPREASNYCLEEGGIDPGDLDAVVYYDNASLTFERMLHTQAAAAPNGREMWQHALPSWVRFKLHLPQLIRKSLHYDGLLLQEAHHRSHCASAFYPSPFERAAILTVDGVGEWATASIARGSGREIELLKEMRFPNSLGLLYSAFTQFTGFKVNSGEYKMMGLAPYGEPSYVDTIMEELIDMKPDGSLQLNLDYFAFQSSRSMTNEAFAKLFGGRALPQDERITQREMDIAKSIQVVTEESLLRMARHAQEVTGERNLCLAGGVAFNCVANGRLLREGPFDDLWIQPSAGDAGCALGAALDAYHTHFAKPRPASAPDVSLQGGSYLGPGYSRDEILAFLETHGYPYRELDDATRAAEIARLLDEGKVVGHFSGRVEFGPRALGARSILGDPRNREMQTTLNLKIKYRESFRPFAPTVLEERASEYFELDRASPYMQIVADVRKEHRLEFERGAGDDMLEIVRKPRSDIPAVTHVDYSARVQTIRRDHHPQYYDLIRAFGERTGTPIVVNTSFNVRGEPIVCSPEDAYRCFMGTEMDVLVLGNFLLRREDQAAWHGRTGHVDESDPVPKEISGRDPLTRDLDRLFDELVKLAAPLRARGALAHAPSASRWSDYAPPTYNPEIFLIPAELDSPDPDPRAMAAAITRYWSSGEVTEALRPLLVKLIALGMRHPLEESLEAEVEDSVYVMF